MATSSMELLTQLQKKLNREHPLCIPCDKMVGTGSDLCHWSPLSAALGGTSSGSWWSALDKLASEDPGCNAAVGCLVGLALGDAAGAPLEFCAVDCQEPGSDPKRPVLAAELREGQLDYQNVRNKFDLKQGQWTDDASMALCLADSLLTRGVYDGGDVRVRWHMWWFHGYCNAFRYDTERRKGQTSVGLGSNVAKSLGEVERAVAAATKDGRLPAGTSHAFVVPPVYQSEANDAGNGSIMRLAPVPIAYHTCPQQALDVAAWQSLATHPGPDAALCCRFMASFCVEAIGRHRNAGKASDSELVVLDPIGDPRIFLEKHIAAFVKESANFKLPSGLDEDGTSAQRLRQLLLSVAPSRKEAHWNWKVHRPEITEAIIARQGRSGKELYNGHPTIPTYFGAYCMDGLAMALWALWNSNSFSAAVSKAVNLLGDADTVGAIAGQMAGAVYGWKKILAEEWSHRLVRNLTYWDKTAEIGLRAALLYHQGPRPRARLQQREGHPKVRAFQGPSPEAGLVGEIPSNEWVLCLDCATDFYHVAHEQSGLQGWVGTKNIAEFAPAAGTEELSCYTLEAGGRDASPPTIPKEPQPRRTLRDFKLPSLVSCRRP